MKMMVAFDIDADIIDVPDEIAEKRNSYPRDTVPEPYASIVTE